MGLFGSKTPAPTLDDRAAKAKAKTGAIVGRFQGFVTDLEDGAADHEAVADATQAEAARLNSLANSAAADAAQARALASNVRNLLS